MTVQPFGRLPVPGALPTGPTGAPVPTANAEGFLGLLLAALPTAGGSPGVLPDVAADPEVEEVVADGTGETEGASGTDGQATDPAVLAALALGVPAALRAGTQAATVPGLPTGQVPGPIPGTVPGSVPGQVAGAAAEPGTATGAGDASGSAATSGDGTGTTPGPIPEAAASRTADPAAGTEPGQPGALRLPEGLVPVEAATAGARVPAEGSPAGQAAAAVAPAEAAVATSPATGPSASAATASPTPTAATSQVTHQVFPEVGRLVSRGDGTHRLTMTLNPAALGDVRVTLSVRDGAVTVTFAAADQAQAALLEGAPELRRLLETVGAQETRVLVRDLAATGTSTATTGPSDPAGGSAQEREAGAGPDPRTDSQGREAPTDRHARTRADQIATDGAARGPGDPRTAHDPDTRRPGGVDVTV